MIFFYCLDQPVTGALEESGDKLILLLDYFKYSIGKECIYETNHYVI